MARSVAVPMSESEGHKMCVGSQFISVVINYCSSALSYSVSSRVHTCVRRHHPDSNEYASLYTVPKHPILVRLAPRRSWDVRAPNHSTHLNSFISGTSRLQSEYRVRCASEVTTSIVFWFPLSESV